MVPVEPVSLSIGIATLFTTCIECFEYFKAAKGFEHHYEVLLVKLEYQQERLLVWGDLAGISEEKQHSGGPISGSDYKHQDLTKRCLDRIHHILKDTETLKTKYGLRAYTPTSESAPKSGISSNALKRFRLRLGRQSQGAGVLDKTRWAIHDETKFQKLVQDIRELIDGLMTKVPVSPQWQERKVQDDIASMVDDIQSLRLFQEACKDDYPEWWTAASAAIDASDVATLDNRLADERLELNDTSNRGEISTGVHVLTRPTTFGDQKVYTDVKFQIFFVLTDLCRAQDSDTPCDQTRLGDMSFQAGHSFIAPGSVRTRSTPGYRISKYIDPSRYTSADLDAYIENQYSMTAHARTNFENEPEDDGRYHVKVYIYCPPCACQVATALDICLYRNKKLLVDFCIRIDYSQKTCCSASVSRIEGLVSVIDYITMREKNGVPDDWEAERLRSIDREWLEQQIYDYKEENPLETLSPANQLARTVELHKDNRSSAAIVILGETDYCIPLMGAPPFRPYESGRLPKEFQIFRNWQKFHALSKKWLWEREYMGTYSSQDPLPPKRPVPVESDTSRNADSAQRSSKRSKSSTSDQDAS